MEKFQKFLAWAASPIQKILAWAVGFTDGTKAEQSAKHLLTLVAGFTLCRGAAIIYRAIAHNIYLNRPVDMGAVYALSAMVVPVAALAGVIYLNGTESAPKPPAIPKPPEPPKEHP